MEVCNKSHFSIAVRNLNLLWLGAVWKTVLVLCGIYGVLLCSVEQSKLSVDKAKQTLEQTNNDLTAELKQTVTARQEAERRRKVADTQLQETSVRLAETEAKSTELTEKLNKLQVWMVFKQLAGTVFL